MDDNNDCATREIDFGDGCPLKVKEYTLLQDDAGAVVWDAGLVLSYYLAHQQAQGRCLVSGRTCLELGSGTGAVGLTAARLGAAQVYLSDLPHLVPYLRQNIQLNGLGATCSAMPLEWGNPEHLRTARSSALLRGSPDVLLASDVVYTPGTRTAFFAALAAVMATPRLGAAAAAVAAGPKGGAGAAAAAAPDCPGPAADAAGKDPGVGQAGFRCDCGEEAPLRQGLEGGTAPERSDAAGDQAGGHAGVGGGGGCRDDGSAGQDGGGSGVDGSKVLAILAYERRPGVEELPELIRKFALQAREVPQHELHPDWRSEDIHVLHLRKA